MKAEQIFEEAQHLFLEEKYEESARAFSHALASGMDPALGYLSRGVAYLKLQKREQALEDFTRVLEKDANSARGYYYRGVAYLAGNDYERTLADMNRALELDPGQGGAHFLRGTVYGLMGEARKSAKDIKTALIRSETEVQGFVDTFGLLRTQFNKAMAHLAGEREHDPTLVLTEEEIRKVRKWLETPFLAQEV